MIDTGLNVPESGATLRIQQAQLMTGKRHVQMFPIGTPELPLPRGCERHQNSRGVYHFRADAISPDQIDTLAGRENEFLNLGPFSKPEIAARVIAGETPLTIAERTADGVEVRCAVGTVNTLDEQRSFFERTREPGNVIVVDDLRSVIDRRKEDI
jgi:hypothetical protein